MRRLVFKIQTDILQVLTVFDEPLGESNTKRRVKISACFHKKAPNNISIIKSQNLKTRGENLGGTN